MKTNKFRVSFTGTGDELKGKVEIDGSYQHQKDCLLTTLEAVAKSWGMSTSDLIIDLYHSEKK